MNVMRIPPSSGNRRYSIATPATGIQMLGAILAALGVTAPGAKAASASSQERTPSRSFQLQFGTGFASPNNLEEPFIDMGKTRNAGWAFNLKSSSENVGVSGALALGLLDPETYMPTPDSNETNYAATGQFLSGAEAYSSYYADKWTLDWAGNAFGYMQGWESIAAEERESNSVTYTLTPKSAGAATMCFKDIGTGLSRIRLYRAKNKELLERGEIWNPAFIDYVKRYDIVRTMDLQWINNSPIRRFDQIATMEEPWGQQSAFAERESPYFSMPYEALFNLGVKSGAKMWVIIPAEIGATISHSDISLRQKDRPGQLDRDKFAAYTTDHAKEALSSPQWEIFARNFVEQLIASGYPLSRPLYVEVGNEIWNSAPGFFISTYYAVGTGKAFNRKWGVGQGYGILSARWMLALDNELRRRNLHANIVYVIATHTANPQRTGDAFQGLNFYLRSQGKRPGDFLPRTGLAVTNYFGSFTAMSKALFGESDPAKFSPKWIEAVTNDPDELARRVSAYIVDGPPTSLADGPWLEKFWKMHKAIAQSNGSNFLGAYEGGSHLKVPSELIASKVFMDWWIAFHWGSDGADIARKINERLIRAFPGAIIANYKAFGVLSGVNPWFDGHYADVTPMMQMWDEFAKPSDVETPKTP